MRTFTPDTAKRKRMRPAWALLVLVAAWAAYLNASAASTAAIPLEQILENPSNSQLKNCIENHEMGQGILCFVFSKALPMQSHDTGIQETLTDFSSRTSGVFSWRQTVQLENGSLFDKMIDEDKDDADMNLAIRAYPESLILIARQNTSASK